MLDSVKQGLKKILPQRAVFVLRSLRHRGDFAAVRRFLRNDQLGLSRRDRRRMIMRFYRISFTIDAPHSQEEVLAFAASILTMPERVEGRFVEAGCYKGGSTAKFSMAAKRAGRKLLVFDSFEGIPDNIEPHEKNIFGRPAKFKKGDYRGALDEVKANVARFGCLDCCEFVKGWFDDTLPGFAEPLAGIYLDVDLASSTRTCLKYLYPHLRRGGVLYSQDGHLPLVLEVFEDDEFWEQEVGCPRPEVEGLGKSRLIRIVKRD